LPAVELCLIRQVLQHLSNENIKIILENCNQSTYVIVSGRVPVDSNIVHNLEMNYNWNIPLVQNSGVNVDKPSFNFNSFVLLDFELSLEVFLTLHNQLFN